MVEKKNNPILNLTIEFSIESISFVELLEEKRKFVVANQLLKSSTSIGANVHESQNAESKADFIHKMKIAAKEADEVEYYLQLIHQSDDLPIIELPLEQIQSIIKILSKIISSSKSV